MLRTVLTQEVVNDLLKLDENKIRALCDEGRPVGEVTNAKWFYDRLATPLYLTYERGDIAGPLSSLSRQKLKDFWQDPDQEINPSDVDSVALDHGRVVGKLESYELPEHIRARYHLYPKLNAHVRMRQNRLGDESLEWCSYDPTTSQLWIEEIHDPELRELLLKK